MIWVTPRGARTRRLPPLKPIIQAALKQPRSARTYAAGMSSHPSQTTNALNPERSNEKVERIYRGWDAALARLEELPPERLEEGVGSLVNLYAEDGTIESPLIPHLMKVDRGICTGHEELRRFFREVGRRKPSLRKYYRTGYLTDGKSSFGNILGRSQMANKWISSKPLISTTKASFSAIACTGAGEA